MHLYHILYEYNEFLNQNMCLQYTLFTICGLVGGTKRDLLKQ